MKLRYRRKRVDSAIFTCLLQATLVLFIIAGGSTITAAQGPEYTATVLGTGSASPWQTAVTGIANDRKTIVGSSLDLQYGGTVRAAIWRWPYDSYTELDGTWSSASAISAAGSKQVGNTGNGGWSERGRMWRGSPDDFTVLDLPYPFVMTSTNCLSPDGSVQGGFGSYRTGGETIQDQAVIWLGSAAIYEVLHPAWAAASYVNGLSTNGAVQVGGYVLPNSDPRAGNHAAIWHGTSGSIIDLTPPGFRESWCHGTSADGQAQVGQVQDSIGSYATIWRGSSQSATILHPVGALSSDCSAISGNGRWQVGTVYSPAPRLVRWTGTADSLLDLQSFLPSNLVPDGGQCSVNDSGDIVGSARDIVTGRHRAVLWHRNWNGAGSPVSSAPPTYASPIQIIPLPAVTITRAWIAKDPITDHFVIYVETRQTLIQGTGSIQLRLSEPGSFGQGAIDESIAGNVSQGTTTLTWAFDLVARNIPRFVRPMSFKVSATVSDHGNSSLTASFAMPEVKLPLVVVRGLLITGSYEEPVFNQFMTARGYAEEGPDTSYPTLFWAYYDPNNQGLAENATSIDTNLNYVFRTASPVTYANACDVVAHSKGGLVTRMLLLAHPQRAHQIRKLLLCCVPNTGSVWSYLAYSAGELPSDVASELFPTHPWYRFAYPQNFYEFIENNSLKQLNSQSIPFGLRYWLLYGVGNPTPVNYSAIPPTPGVGDGDLYVAKLSALGYEIVNGLDGTSSQGAGISAFYGANAQPPVSALGFYLDHTNFLSNAADAIFGILEAPILPGL